MMNIAASQLVGYFFNNFAETIEKPGPLTEPAICLFHSLVGKSTALVVLAEDDSDEREMFLEAIEQAVPQVAVQVAHHGKDLMNVLLKKDAKLPDLIFLDLNMPFKNGYECLKEIRSNAGLKSIPIIIYSGSTHTHSIQETYNLGATYYFPKPDSIGQLRKWMKKIFAFDWEICPMRDKKEYVLSSNTRVVKDWLRGEM